MTPSRGARLPVVVATGNAGKLREIREILGDAAALASLAEFPAVPMPEEGDDYATNARGKALAVARALGHPALADDSGIEVDALGGRPGPRSARYGGSGLRDGERVERLLGELDGVGSAERSARFVCVAALATPEGAVVTARGECRGRILEAPRGRGGFGYDPVFEPRDENEGGASMAELPAAVKNRISHRARALAGVAAALARVAATGAG